MSGTLPQYRTPSRPTEQVTGFRHVLRPGGLYKNGRCVEWIVDWRPVFRHVLYYPPEPHFPSKHARARIRPRTDKQQRRVKSLHARLTQIGKTRTIDANLLRAFHDEI